MSCLVLQLPTINGSPNARLTMEEINRELERKRQALDEEIRRFTAEKDAEFKAFEREIKSHFEELHACETQTAGHDEASVIERGFSVSKPYETLSQSSPEDNQSYKINLHSSQATSLSSAPNIDNFAKQPIEIRSSLRRTSSQEDSKFELGALFASSYLPLLDSTFNQQDYRKALSNSNERISSSLDTESQAPKIERPLFSDRRLSSSPVNSGRSSKKSSLRRSVGSDSPRERKRVLFSIDNQVISPKASPETLRVAPSIVAGSSFSSLQDPHSNHTTIAGIEAATYLASMGPWTQRLPLITPTRTYKDLVEPTLVTPPEELDQEDLHLITRDPLFDSDEPSLPFEEEEWQQSPPAGKSSDEEEVIATSPHSSSVPIQIRRKGRK